MKRKKSNKPRTPNQIRAHAYNWSKVITKGCITQLEWIERHTDNNTTADVTMRREINAVREHLRDLLDYIDDAFEEGRTQ